MSPVVFVVCVMFQTAAFLSNIRDRIKPISGRRDICVWQPSQTYQPGCCQLPEVTQFPGADIWSYDIMNHDK